MRWYKEMLIRGNLECIIFSCCNDVHILIQSFEEWTLITSHQIARPIKNLWSLNIFGNAYSYSSYNSITYIQVSQ